MTDIYGYWLVFQIYLFHLFGLNGASSWQNFKNYTEKSIYVEKNKIRGRFRTILLLMISKTFKSQEALVPNEIIAIQSSQIMYTMTKDSPCYYLIDSMLPRIFHDFLLSRYNFHYFLCSRRLNAVWSRRWRKLSSSVSKLQLKVSNGSLLKVVAPLCETPTLIFRTVAFQHFILVLQSHHLLPIQLRDAFCPSCLSF